MIQLHHLGPSRKRKSPWKEEERRVWSRQSGYPTGKK
jgi:hypothetical protein